MQTDRRRKKRLREINAHVRFDVRVRRNSSCKAEYRALSNKSAADRRASLAFVEQLEGPLQHLILQSTRQE